VDEQVFDVGGVPLLVRAPDAARARLVTSDLGGFPATDARPVVSISVVTARGETPGRPFDDEFRGLRFWLDGDGIVVASSGALVLRAAGDAAIAHLPDVGDGDLLQDVTSLALTWLLGAHARFVLHGGALACDDRAVLVLGNTGSGKSTLAAAALDAGWAVLADDQVVLDASGPPGAPDVVHGLHRSPAIPREIGGAHAAAGIALGDPRDRAELPRAVLAGGGVPVAGVVLVTHSELDTGELVPAPASTVFPLALQSFPGSAEARLRARFFPVAGRLSRLPAFTLAHATVASRRRARAAAHLQSVFESLSDAT
jgi:hypothetical protein